MQVCVRVNILKVNMEMMAVYLSDIFMRKSDYVLTTEYSLNIPRRLTHISHPTRRVGKSENSFPFGLLV